MDCKIFVGFKFYKLTKNEILFQVKHILHRRMSTENTDTMGCCLTTTTNEFTSDELNVKLLSEFVPPITRGRVVKVYDGDTITIASRVPGLANSPVYKFSIRLAGIDTPELRGSSDEEKEVALGARDALSARILDRDVQLRNVSLEKYGRLLCDVFDGGIGDVVGCDDVALSLNSWLVQERWAVPYDGGTKRTPVSWKKYRETGDVN